MTLAWGVAIIGEPGEKSSTQKIFHHILPFGIGENPVVSFLSSPHLNLSEIETSLAGLETSPDKTMTTWLKHLHHHHLRNWDMIQSLINNIVTAII